jgi:hypothetical protein
MASFTVVKTAFVGEEKPTCWRFFEKYSAVELDVIFLLPRGLGVDAGSDFDDFLVITWLQGLKKWQNSP